MTELPIGPHTITMFNGTDLLGTYPLTIVQDRWNLNQQFYVTFLGLEIDIFGGIEPYGAPQIFNNPECVVPDSTVAYLLQDGIAIDSVVGTDFTYQFTQIWPGLPYGHTYQTKVVDHSHCGSYGIAPLLTAYSSGEVEFTINSQDADESVGGSIQVAGLTTDPLSPLPPPTPFTGTFALFQLPDHTPVGSEQAGTTAFWDNLPAGDYDVFFTPDSLCNLSDTVITIGTTTGITEDRAAHGEPFVVWPQPVHDVLQWKPSANGVVRVHDTQSRLIVTGPDRGRLDVSAIPAGLYQLQIAQGTRTQWARFIKQ